MSDSFFCATSINVALRLVRVAQAGTIGFLAVVRAQLETLCCLLLVPGWDDLRSMVTAVLLLIDS